MLSVFNFILLKAILGMMIVGIFTVLLNIQLKPSYYNSDFLRAKIFHFIDFQFKPLDNACEGDSGSPVVRVFEGTAR